MESILENYKWIFGVAILGGIVLTGIIFFNDYKIKKQEDSVYYEDKAIFEGFLTGNPNLGLKYLKKLPKNSVAYKRAKLIEYKYTNIEQLQNFISYQNYLGDIAKDTYTGYLIDKKDYQTSLNIASSVSLDNFVFPDMTLYGFESAIFINKNLAKDFYSQINTNLAGTLYQAIASILALEYNLTLSQ